MERALVDRGANGGIAGSDCVVIDEPMVSRSVNCTGIGNHQLVNIPSEVVARCAFGAKQTPHLHCLQGPRVHTPSPVDYEIMKPFFCWIPTKLIQKTFENSTQYGTLPASADGNLFHRFKSLIQL